MLQPSSLQFLTAPCRQESCVPLSVRSYLAPGFSSGFWVSELRRLPLDACSHFVISPCQQLPLTPADTWVGLIQGSVIMVSSVPIWEGRSVTTALHDAWCTPAASRLGYCLRKTRNATLRAEFTNALRVLKSHHAVAHAPKRVLSLAELLPTPLFRPPVALYPMMIQHASGAQGAYVDAASFPCWAEQRGVVDACLQMDHSSGEKDSQTVVPSHVFHETSRSSCRDGLVNGWAGQRGVVDACCQTDPSSSEKGCHCLLYTSPSPRD